MLTLSCFNKLKYSFTVLITDAYIVTALVRCDVLIVLRPECPFKYLIFKEIEYVYV